MTLGSLLTGLIFLIIGSILYYFLSSEPKEKPIPKQKVNINFVLRFIGSLFRPMTMGSIMGSIFMILGLLSILTFCLGMDGRNYTLEKEDDMTILNGIIIGICCFSLESNIAYILRKLKKYRQLKKRGYTKIN